jgi:transcriptional regulator with XRE-family HTH domain
MNAQKMSPKRFQQIRNMLGLSQHQMAHMIGYESRSSICLFESGQRPISPRVSILMEMLAEKNDGKPK